MDIIYPPTTESNWKIWGNNLADLLQAGPTPYGIPLPVTTSVVSAAVGYTLAFDLASAPVTRSKSRIAAKRTALTALRQAVKPAVGLIQANTDVTDADRVDLGLKIPDLSPTRSPVPTTSPVVSATLTGPQSIRVEAKNPLDANRRAKPTGVSQIAIHTYFGTVAPALVSQWPLTKLAGRSTTDLYWAEMVSETTVWVCCSYLNSRGQSGPFSAAVSVRLPGSGLGQTQPQSASAESTTLKIAA